ncbi:inositol phospholipid synthesis and fat-storage-inducing TM-domain-containing protein [Pestalotiopsis sp. NC0098]|nr:inositol phospholipid synthesis and fat-storage-inducing TM-domain-containing protein [Pestalotiopsis sp. NC0098]
MADDTYSLRSRPVKMAATSNEPGSPSSSNKSSSSTSTATTRTPPPLPTPAESLLLLVYPVLLLFGTVFSALSPETRAAAYDAAGQSHVQAEAPSYFARKNNLFNVLFVKRGWAWVTVAFFVFALTHPRLGGNATRKLQAVARWAAVTTWWVLVTQWCFGPALIDRGFRFTGGKCEVAETAVFEGGVEGSSKSDVFTAVACKASGGKWSGGHDISGHVFLLVLGSWFLLQEVGWVVARAAAAGKGVFPFGREERCVVMHDGAVKGAGVEAYEKENVGEEARIQQQQSGATVGSKFAIGVVGLCLWMLLMTAIYFHTWFEKLTGLLTALIGIYPIYYLPRWVPGLRSVIGLPGI